MLVGYKDCKTVFEQQQFLKRIELQYENEKKVFRTNEKLETL